MKVIFIAGAGRSGSTLLDLILGELDRCFSVGELRQVFKKFIGKNALCSCGKPYKECNFWAKILTQECLKSFGLSLEDIETLYKLQKILEKLPILNSLKQRKYIQTYFREIELFKRIWFKLYQLIFDTSRAEIIIDSSKIPQFLWLLKDYPNEVYIIHLVRDPRGVAYSWTKRKFDYSVGDYMKTHRPFTSARLWLTYNLQIEKLKKYFKNYYLLKYEDFCKEPYESLVKIFKKFKLQGINIDEIIKNKHIYIKKEKHLLGGNPIRFLADKEIKLKIDEEWKNKLALKDKLIVSLLTFPLLKKYKYI